MGEPKNLVIRAWTDKAWDFVRERSVTVEFAAGEMLSREGKAFTHFVFPQSGIVSIQTAIDGTHTVEVMSIGYEGFIGLPLLAFGSTSEGDVKGLVSGEATFVPRQSLEESFDLFPCVRQAMLRYGRFTHQVMMQSVSCARGHRADQLIALWLLMTMDRLDSSEVPITHETLANLLGLRRATVTTTLSKLAQNDTLETRRGVIHVSDRDQLESICGRYYRKWRDSFNELSGALSETSHPYP